MARKGEDSVARERRPVSARWSPRGVRMRRRRKSEAAKREKAAMSSRVHGRGGLRRGGGRLMWPMVGADADQIGDMRIEGERSKKEASRQSSVRRGVEARKRVPSDRHYESMIMITTAN